jgi:hypothetical protein
MVAFASPGHTPEGTAASTAPAATPSVTEAAITQTSVDRGSIRQNISQQAGLATLKNQDLVNYAYLVLMKEKGHSAPNAYEHAAAKLEKQFGVKLHEVERLDARQGTSQIRITDANREILTSRFGIGATKNETPQPSQDLLTGQKIINDLYSQARELQRQYGANAGRLVGSRSNDQDAIVNRLAEIAGIKEATGHTVWEIANSHRKETFSAKHLDQGKFEKELASIIASNHATLSRGHASERTNSQTREHRSDQPASRDAQAERRLEGKEFIATTVIEPGGRIIKHVRDTITDTDGNPIVVVERSRMNLGPLSFNLPGRDYKVSEGIPQEQAREMARDYIRNSSRRNRSE